MFEDMPHNLLAPHELGMTTVLVYSATIDHPVANNIRTWTETPDHIHHMTEDLRIFLDGIADGNGTAPRSSNESSDE